jgi:hypothetical protein
MAFARPLSNASAADVGPELYADAAKVADDVALAGIALMEAVSYIIVGMFLY